MSRGGSSVGAGGLEASYPMQSIGAPEHPLQFLVMNAEKEEEKEKKRKELGRHCPTRPRLLSRQPKPACKPIREADLPARQAEPLFLG